MCGLQYGEHPETVPPLVSQRTRYRLSITASGKGLPIAHRGPWSRTDQSQPACHYTRLLRLSARANDSNVYWRFRHGGGGRLATKHDRPVADGEAE